MAFGNVVSDKFELLHVTATGYCKLVIKSRQRCEEQRSHGTMFELIAIGGQNVI